MQPGHSRAAAGPQPGRKRRWTSLNTVTAQRIHFTCLKCYRIFLCLHILYFMGFILYMSFDLHRPQAALDVASDRLLLMQARRRRPRRRRREGTGGQRRSLGV